MNERKNERRTTNMLKEKKHAQKVRRGTTYESSNTSTERIEIPIEMMDEQIQT